MKHLPVRSSIVKTVAYDPKTLKMQVVFNNGSCYEYHNISPTTHQQLLTHKSIGSFLNTTIAPKHKFNKIS